MSSMFNFFVGFRIGNSYGKVRSDEMLISNNVRQYTAHLES